MCFILSQQINQILLQIHQQNPTLIQKIFLSSGSTKRRAQKCP